MSEPDSNRPLACRRKRAHLTTAVALVALVATSSEASDMSMSAPGRNFSDLIEKIAHAKPLDRKAIEKLVGAKFTLMHSEFFDSYEVRNFLYKNVPIESIEYRESGKESSAKLSPMIFVKLGNIFINRVEIINRFELSEVVNVPHGHSWDEETVYAKFQPWGGLNFGFSAGKPECLKTVAFITRGVLTK